MSDKNMAAFVSEGCRVSRKPWRKLQCDDDNRALSAHKAHQSVLSWLILAQGSRTSKQLSDKTNKSRAGQSILSSLTVLCVVINIHRRDTVSVGLGGWRGWAEDWVGLNSGDLTVPCNRLQTTQWRSAPNSRASHFIFLSLHFLVFFSFLRSHCTPLTWCDHHQPPHDPLANPLSGSRAQRRRGLPDVIGGVKRARA